MCLLSIRSKCYEGLVYGLRSRTGFLKRETEKMHAPIAKVHDAINRLKGVRTGLISAAVTGKIDAREAV